MRIHRSLLTELLALAASAVAVLGFFGCESPPEGENTNPPASISEMLSQIRESEILATATDLQNFGTRVVGYQGNVNAAEYIHQRLTSMSELTVTYQGGDLRNVVATLPGTDGASDKVYIVGAHYDSASSTPTISPGATDNACGVGIVLELARIMSTQRFKHDLKFAAWNGEETGPSGSAAYTYEAVTNNENIELYVNYDSAAYDPEGRLILDIIYNDASLQFAEMMEQDNSRYGIGFAVAHNVHLSCASDHKVFWTRGFCSITTHSEQHAPGTHSPSDTVEKISTAYAKKNGQVGMAVLAELAELITAR